MQQQYGDRMGCAAAQDKHWNRPNRKVAAAAATSAVATAAAL